MRALTVLGLIGLTACPPPPPADVDAGPPDAGREPVSPTPNAAREITDTALTFDLQQHTATATITFGPGDAGATLEVGDLVIDTSSLEVARHSDRADLALPASAEPLQVTFAYHWQNHEAFTGASVQGYTLTWPYFCGNLFPCHSQPSDGTTFSLALSGVPDGQTAVYPARIDAQAPAYMIAWTISDYVELPLGTTDAGTQLVVRYHPGELDDVRAGTAHLLDVFQWYEHTLGPYAFGTRVGPVSANWGPLVNGGMEHHPYWHIGPPALKSADTQAHEAAHGWFGDGVRLQCWEDLVLSEGTVSYLAARSLEVVAPDAGAESWAANAHELTTSINPLDKVWPPSCGELDVLKDGLFTRAPYLRGAFFFRAVALKVGPEQLDFALSAFYRAHVGQASTMEELLRVIHVVTGYDPHACAEQWLRSPDIPTIGPCP